MENQHWLQDGAANAAPNIRLKSKNSSCCDFAPPTPHYLQFHHLPLAEAFVTGCITAATSHSPLQYCKAWSNLALDRGACQPHTVIMPELTSLLSIELLRRWRGHEIPCSEKQHCSCPSGLWEKKKSKRTQLHQKTTTCQLVLLAFVILQATLVHVEKMHTQHNRIIPMSDTFTTITTWFILTRNKEGIWGMRTRVFN